MKKLKLGQIGIGHNHGEGKMLAARKFPDLFEVIGYAEESEEWIAKRGGLGCYRDLPRLSVEEVLSRADVILVECDVKDLTRVAQRCIDAGKHVHIDKPASGTLAEFSTLLQTAKAKGLVVQMGYMYRYNHAIRRLLEMVRAGELGEIHQIDAEMSTYHTPVYREWLRQFRGGTMYIFGSHLLDLVIQILGEPKKVHSFIRQTGDQNVFSDDNAVAVLEYERALAKITTLSVEVNGWGLRHLTVLGSRGTVQIQPIECDVKMQFSSLDLVGGRHYADVCTPIAVADVPQNCRYDDMIQDLHAYVNGTKINPYSYEHEFVLQKILYKITQNEENDHA